MNTKIIIASGAVVVAVGASVFLHNQSTGGTPEGKLLRDYEQFSEKINSENTRKNLLSLCDNPQDFANKISNLEAELAVLMAQRAALSLQPETNDGSKPLELSDGDYSQPSPRPGSEPLELSDGDYSQPGSKPLELSDGDYSQPSPRPGSEPLELSDGDYSQPGSKPLELSDGDYSQPGSEPLDLSDGDYGIGGSDMGKMYVLEQGIKSSLANLKSLCEKEEDKNIEPKIISDKCSDACQRYKACTAYSDATPADLQDAYDTCLEECATWPKEMIQCMNKMEIKKPNDCVGFLNCQMPKFYEENYLP